MNIVFNISTVINSYQQLSTVLKVIKYELTPNIIINNSVKKEFKVPKTFSTDTLCVLYDDIIYYMFSNFGSLLTLYSLVKTCKRFYNFKYSNLYDKLCNKSKKIPLAKKSLIGSFIFDLMYGYLVITKGPEKLDNLIINDFYTLHILVGVNIKKKLLYYDNETLITKNTIIKSDVFRRKNLLNLMNILGNDKSNNSLFL